MKDQVREIVRKWEDKIHVLGRSYHDGVSGVPMIDAINILRFCADEVARKTCGPEMERETRGLEREKAYLHEADAYRLANVAPEREEGP